VVSQKCRPFFALSYVRLFLGNRQAQSGLDEVLDLRSDGFGVGVRADNANDEIIGVSTLVQPPIVGVERIATG